MTVAPLIAMKSTKCESLEAVGKELFAPDKRRKNAEGKWEVTAQGTMSRLQEDFWEQVAKPYGYERPMRHELRAKGYRSLDAYKVQVGYNSILERYCRGNYLNAERQRKRMEQAGAKE